MAMDKLLMMLNLKLMVYIVDVQPQIILDNYRNELRIAVTNIIQKIYLDHICILSERYGGETGYSPRD